MEIQKPTIADFTSSNHDHSTISGGGLLNNYALVSTVATISGSLYSLIGTTSAGSGNVTKVGTPVNNQIGVWTGDGTIKGDPNFTWDTTSLTLLGDGRQVLAPSGTAANPSYSFNNASNTGMYLSANLASDTIAWTTDGTVKASLNVGGLVLAVPVLSVDGSASAPSIAFTLEASTGLYRIGTNNIGISISGSKEIDITQAVTTFSHNVSVGGQLYSTPFALTAAASISADCNQSNVFTLTLNQSTTLANPLNIQPGSVYNFVLTQPISGAYTIAFGTYFQFPGTVAPSMPSSNSSATKLRIECLADSATTLLSTAAAYGT